MSLSYETVLPDRDQFFLLFESTGWNQRYGLTKEELASALENSFFTISVYDGQELVAFGRLLSDGVLHAMINEMIVKPGYQGRGIGKEVLKRLVDRCRRNSIRDVQLFCARGKRGFYEKQGFAVRPDDGPGMELKGGPAGSG